MKKYFKKTSILPAVAGCLLLAGASACNSNEKGKENNNVDFSSSVAVKSFSLKAEDDDAVDSAFFSIDLDHRVIYNADSLPKNTDITKLVPTITFSSTVNEATLIMKGGTVKEGESNYKRNPDESIDFSGTVDLRVMAQDGLTVQTFRIKVNVHQEESDTLLWDKLGSASLPSRLENPRQQKSVLFSDKITTLLEESDGSYTIATNPSPAVEKWTKSAVAFGFTPDVRSLSATTQALYILDTAGNMYSSTDGAAWTSTSQKWNVILGAYAGRIIGLSSASGAMKHVEYPARAGFVSEEIEEGFPVKGFSQLVSMTTRWVDNPISFIVGGITAAGEHTGATWAYDGAEWSQISERRVPAMEGAAVSSYRMERQSVANSNNKTEFDIWILIGGKLADGTLNPDIYITYDNGINWEKAPQMAKLPKEVEPRAYADLITLSRDMNANVSDAWKASSPGPLQAKLARYTINGDVISWTCPYLYLIGGDNAQGIMFNAIWKGLITRFSFTPII